MFTSACTVASLHRCWSEGPKEITDLQALLEKSFDAVRRRRIITKARECREAMATVNDRPMRA
jgi:hypothetical protein